MTEGLLRRLEQNQIAAACRSRRVVEAGPFTLTISPQTKLTWFNYAIPVRAEYGSEDVADLLSRFEEEDRTPRLEVLDALHPALEALLLSQGFVVEHRLPLMVADQASFRPLAGYEPIVATGDDQLRAVMEVGNSVFGMPDGFSPEDWINRNRDSIGSGHLVAAYLKQGDDPAASAMMMIEGDVAELAGVATKEQYRRRGLSAAVNSFLMNRFFSGGGNLVWLSAGDEPAKALYQKLGFRSVGTQTTYLRPSD